MNCVINKSKERSRFNLIPPLPVALLQGNSIRISKLLLCAHLMLSFLALAAAATETNFPTIVVANVSAGPNIPNWRSSTGRNIADALITQLAASAKVRVLESSQIETLRNEIKMGQDGWMEPSLKTEQGHWHGADYMLTAKLTVFEKPPKTEKSRNIFTMGKKGRIQLLWRVVNTSTRSVAASGTADSNRSRKKLNLLSMAKGVFGASEDESEAMDVALGIALDQIVSEVDLLDLAKNGQSPSAGNSTSSATSEPGRIAGTVDAVKPDFLIVGVGTKHGCKQGDKLELCELVDIKNSEGKSVFRDEKVVGEIELSMCLEERSKATYTSLVPPKEGWLVRRKSLKNDELGR